MTKKMIFKRSLFVGVFLGLLFTGCEKNDAVSELKREATVQLRSTIVEGTYAVFNVNSYKALDLHVSASNIIQYSYWSSSNQKWVITGVGSGYYKICPTSDTSLAIDIEGASTSNGGNVKIATYTGSASQQFQFVNVGGTAYKIINRNSGLALDVYQQSVDNEANVTQWSYWGGTNQQWVLNLAIGNSNGQLGWTLTTSGVPADVQTRITNAMNAAVARYNSWGDWPSRTLTVEYNTGVATADGNINGNIRFGANSAYQTECTAMHEIAHTYGVGTSSNWSSPLIVSSQYVGTNAVAALQAWDGSSATISTGGSHFWPYGLNYNSEWSEFSGDKHAQIVWGMYQDGLY